MCPLVSMPIAPTVPTPALKSKRSCVVIVGTDCLRMLHVTVRFPSCWVRRPISESCPKQSWRPASSDNPRRPFRIPFSSRTRRHSRPSETREECSPSLSGPARSDGRRVSRRSRFLRTTDEENIEKKCYVRELRIGTGRYDTAVFFFFFN